MRGVLASTFSLAGTPSGVSSERNYDVVQIRLPLSDRWFGDSPLEQSGFELVWGFSCQVVVLGFAESSLFGAGKPFFIPSPAIRFAERAEGVKGPKR
jgi:hypothetical protein